MIRFSTLAVRITATAIILLAMLWAVTMFSAGASMGWSNRNVLQIVELSLFGLLFPTAVTILFAVKAKSCSKQDAIRISIGWLLAALCPIPLFYVVEIALWR